MSSNNLIRNHFIDNLIIQAYLIKYLLFRDECFGGKYEATVKKSADLERW